jgi:hypothetical protein
MNESSFNIESAVNLLKKAVKFSAVEGQKHVDLSICVAEEREKFQRALIFLNLEVEKGTLSQDELKTRLGLI